MLQPGQAVRVKLDCHIRTPHYLRGAIGTVERHLGDFRNPEELAFARPAEAVALYHVRFDQPQIWGEGRSGDAVVVEIFAHWLEAV